MSDDPKNQNCEKLHSDWSVKVKAFLFCFFLVSRELLITAMTYYVTAIRYKIGLPPDLKDAAGSKSSERLKKAQHTHKTHTTLTTVNSLTCINIRPVVTVLHLSVSLFVLIYFIRCTSIPYQSLVYLLLIHFYLYSCKYC